MARRSRMLLRFPKRTSHQELEQLGETLLAACPEASRFSDEEVEEFFIMAYCLDGIGLKTLRRSLRKARICAPPHLQVDLYRLGRYAIRCCWREPSLRATILSEICQIDFKGTARLRSATDVEPIRGLLHGQGLGGLWFLRQIGLADRIPDLLAALTPEELTWLRGQKLYARYLLHRYLTEPELVDRRISMREQKQIIRRIRRHELQLRSLRRSLYTLTSERKALVAAVRACERASDAELASLTGQLKQLQLDLAEAERGHAEAMARTAARQAVEVGGLQALVDAELADQAAALEERQRWAPARPLTNRRIAVVGAESREAEFRSRIERLGGTLVHFSGTDRFSQLSEGLGDADIVLLMTADMKHAAEWVVRKAAPPGAMVLRCPAAGAASLDRILAAEVLPRLAATAADSREVRSR